MNILDTLVNARDGNVLRQLASRFQLDENQARSAVEEPLPGLARGLRHNAASPQGLEAPCWAFLDADPDGSVVDDLLRLAGRLFR